ncbi:MAG TPA: PilT/PilU family type 4a pilus ATPase [Myxococcaceae bacterium]|nr:PilT/PilU family type 4a pilus ATPase [Myxococcaceae bacterium]
MARIDSFLRLVAEQQASDLHFHAGNPPIIRHDGELMPLPFRTLTRDEVRRFIFEILTPEQKEEFERTNELDFIYIIDGVGRFRTNVLVQTYGIGAVFRIIPQLLPELSDLMFPRAIRKLTQLQNGLVLVCGPTGCGKTTTLAAMVNEINRTSQRHVITIEDPIEFLHTPIQSTITQRQVGKHTDSFAGALRSALRESPDVIVIGEMRDLETITLALSATETGVLVFGTLHTNSASKAIDRVIDAVGEDGQDQMRAVLSVLLRAVVSQQLCKKANSDGRVAALEILLQNYAVANMIRENKLHQLEGYLQTASSDGSGAQSLDHAILNFVKEGAVTLEEGMRVASYPDQLKSLVQELPQDN